MAEYSGRGEISELGAVISLPFLSLSFFFPPPEQELASETCTSVSNLSSDYMSMS